MKAHHLTIKTNPVAEAHPLFKEARDFARELNKLTEGKDLNDGERHTLFVNAEKAMTDAGGNRTMLGKAGEMAGAVGQKIRGLAQALQDTTPVKGVDSMFDDLKQKASASLGKSPQGSTVLRSLDQYKQLVQRHPNTSKFFWGVAGVLTGLLTGGAAPVIALGATKMIDSLIQGQQFSTAVGSGLKTAGTALATKAALGAGKAAAQGVHNAVDAVSNIGTGGAENVPSTSGAENVPSTSGAENVPNTGGAENVPSTGGAETTTIKAPANGNLSTIAQQHGTSVEHLQQLNPSIKNPDVIAQGQDIVVPAKATGAPVYDKGIGTSADTMAKIKAGTVPNSAISQAAAAKAAGAKPMAESFRFRAGKGVLEGIQLITLPTAFTVDKSYTIQKWALNESLGRPRNSVQLSEAGVMTMFMNLQRIDEAVYSRPGNANDPRAMAKNKPAPNVSNSAGPQGELPGGPSPVGNTMPYLAADPEGQFDTKYKGAVSSKLSRGIETGLGRAGNWIKDKWKDMSTKVTAAGLERHWKDAGSPTDSDQIAAVLQRLKVPNEVITQLYQQLNYPAPKLAAVAAAAPAATTAATTPAADATASNAATDAEGNPRQYQDGTVATTGSEPTASAEPSTAVGGTGGGSVADRLMGGGATGGSTSAQQATAQREIDQDIDDVIRSLLRMDNRMQPAMVKYIRDRLDQHFPAAAAAAAVAPVQQQQQSQRQLGPRPMATPKRTGTANESRKRTYGGRYVKEAADQKLAREFENFLLKME